VNGRERKKRFDFVSGIDILKIICRTDLHGVTVSKTYPRDVRARPFLKWAGGKTQLLDAIDARLPESIKETGTIDRYVEPFVGGGAVFFHLQNHYQIQESFLLDINRELIVGYRVIQETPEKLIQWLHEIETKYLELSESGRKKYYYRTRDQYNARMKHFDYTQFGPGWIKRAAQLIFLNKTCYNGLFRQNKKGEFNVPHGRYVNPTICDEENLRAVHFALQNTKIICADFRESEKYISRNSFVYFDPPYRPLNKTSGFTSYFKSDFTDDDQRDLAAFYHRMHQRGAFLLLNNSDPKNEDPDDNFFENLYGKKAVAIDRVLARRFINRNGTGRGPINELTVYNY